MNLQSSLQKKGRYHTQIFHCVSGVKRTIKGLDMESVREGSHLKIDTKDGRTIIINPNLVFMTESFPEEDGGTDTSTILNTFQEARKRLQEQGNKVTYYAEGCHIEPGYDENGKLHEMSIVPDENNEENTNPIYVTDDEDEDNEEDIEMVGIVDKRSQQREERIKRTGEIDCMPDDMDECEESLHDTIYEEYKAMPDKRGGVGRLAKKYNMSPEIIRMIVSLYQ